MYFEYKINTITCNDAIVLIIRTTLKTRHLLKAQQLVLLVIFNFWKNKMCNKM